MLEMKIKNPEYKVGCVDLFSDQLGILGSSGTTLVRITVTFFVKLRHNKKKRNFLSEVLQYTPRGKKNAQNIISRQE